MSARQEHQQSLPCSTGRAPRQRSRNIPLVRTANVAPRNQYAGTAAPNIVSCGAELSAHELLNACHGSRHQALCRYQEPLESSLAATARPTASTGGRPLAAAPAACRLPAATHVGRLRGVWQLSTAERDPLRRRTPPAGGSASQPWRQRRGSPGRGDAWSPRCACAGSRQKHTYRRLLAGR